MGKKIDPILLLISLVVGIFGIVVVMLGIDPLMGGDWTSASGVVASLIFFVVLFVLIVWVITELD